MSLQIFFPEYHEIETCTCFKEVLYVGLSSLSLILNHKL